MESAPDANPNPPDAPPHPLAVIIGFGLPGRFVAEVLDARSLSYCVIELNPMNAKNILATGKCVVVGDACDPEILKLAGVQTAQILAITIPHENAVLEVLRIARALNPSIKMIARCNYTSTGIKAEKAGACAVIVEEQIAAIEFARLIGKVL